MQRKNSILRRNHRNGMAMIMAVTVIVIVATIMALSLSLATQTSKKTTDLYLYEQAAILAHSAAEYAVLQASLAAPCSFNGGGTFTHNTTFSITTSMQYISVVGTTCNVNAAANSLSYAVTTNPDSDGTVIMDITVSTNQGTEPIRYFRRSIQKL